MKVRTCPTTGKRQYLNASRAQKVIAEAARRARDAGSVAIPMAAYKCLSYSRWHLTHYTPQESRQFIERDKRLRAFRKQRSSA